MRSRRRAEQGWPTEALFSRRRGRGRGRGGGRYVERRRKETCFSASCPAALSLDHKSEDVGSESESESEEGGREEDNLPAYRSFARPSAAVERRRQEPCERAPATCQTCCCCCCCCCCCSLLYLVPVALLEDEEDVQDGAESAGLKLVGVVGEDLEKERDVACGDVLVEKTEKAQALERLFPDLIVLVLPQLVRKEE
eukprot:758593-Hanusia_phi.AAC.1